MIAKGEVKQLVRWTGIWVFAFFTALAIREQLMVYLKTPFQQILFGIVGLLVWAYIFDLKKYSG